MVRNRGCCIAIDFHFCFRVCH